MKNAHFLLWFGLGGLLSYAIGQFLTGIETMINYFIWASLMSVGGVITTMRLKKKEEQKITE
jgi:hypothetical protein